MVWLAATAAASAQTVDCAAPDLSGPESRYCTAVAYERADAKLNRVYGLLLTRARVFDEAAAVGGFAGPLALQEAIRQAQRDWIPFRDSACDAEAVVWGNGTGAPTAGTLCRVRLTVARVADLERLYHDLE